VAGLALRTRSVHPLPAIAPRREHTAVPVGRADGARSAFGFTSLFLAIALLGVVLRWATRLERVEPTVTAGTVHRIDQLAELGAWGSVIGLAVGLLALVQWSARRVSATLARRRDRDVLV
jgi:hypothetical protein